MKYRKIYKYELSERFVSSTRCRPHLQRDFAQWLKLSKAGWLEIREGYSWDGPSGPALDTKNFMRASLVHDALYQMIQEGLLHPRFRKEADQTMLDICKADGMNFFRRWYCYLAVRIFGGSHAKL